MSGLRCPQCLVNWPHSIKDGDQIIQFATCPECDSKTDYTCGDPMDDDEALSRKRHADFEKYYVERSAKHIGDELDQLVHLED